MTENKDIEIGEDLEFQRKSWKFQRIGMIALMVIVILSILGLGGNGPLSKGTAESTGGNYHISYEKISRLSTPAELTIALSKDLTVNDTLRVLIDKTFINVIEIQTIMPEPADQKDEDKFIEFSFPRGSKTHPDVIHFNYLYRHYGSMEFSVRINNEECKLKQFIWP